MPESSHPPAAITGLGLLCHRAYSPRAHDDSPSLRRFIYINPLPTHPAQGRALQSSRSLTLAASAAIQAAAHPDLNRKTCGTAIVISKGLIEHLEAGVERLKTGASNIPPISGCGPDAGAQLVSRILHLGGPAAAAVAACASGLASIKLGLDWLRDGVCETVLAGAAESSHSELILRSFERLGVISAQGQTRPFDTRRDGFVAGEGAAIFRIEDAHRAAFNAERGAGPPVLGAILSVALGSDAHHLTTPDMSGEMLARVIEIALHRAGLEPEQIGWIHAHGTATAYNDTVEIAALRRVFHRRIPPITATKGATGHLLGASGAVALALSLEALRANTIPHITGLENPAPEFENIDFVITQPRPSIAKTALVLNHGFGGHIAAAVVSI